MGETPGRLKGREDQNVRATVEFELDIGWLGWKHVEGLLPCGALRGQCLLPCGTQGKCPPQPGVRIPALHTAMASLTKYRAGQNYFSFSSLRKDG